MRGLFRELRRRKVFRMAGFYVVGAWLIMQAADVFFPAWGVPDAAINVLLVAAVVGFPLALVFGWFYDVTTRGIVRTPTAGEDDRARDALPLQRTDYLILAALAGIAAFIVFRAGTEIAETPRIEADSSVDAHADAGPLLEKSPNSIVVLPFDNISTDPENDVFSDGISEEIRNRLGQYADLRVIARASMFQFKGSDYGIAKISALLGVRYLLQGSVRKQGNRIRVTARLVADEGAQLWSQNYDRVLEDVFGIQDEIADLVAAEVVPQIVAGLESSYQPSLDAYKSFLAGRDLIYRRNQWAAQQELARAVQLDPDYAEAQAEYAISLLLGYPEEQQLKNAKAAIDTALTLAPDLPRAHAALGLLMSMSHPPDPAASEAALREALARDPNMVDAMNWLGGALGAQGRQEEADEWLERAYALDPFSSPIVTNMALRVWEQGDPDRTEAMLRRLAELPEPPAQAMLTLCEFYTDTGRLVEAHEIAKRLLLAGGTQDYFLALSYALLSQPEIAAEWMSAAAREHPEVMWVRTGWMQAQAPLWEGDYGRAAGEMRQAMASSGISLEQIDPQLRLFYGINQALAGEFAGAIGTLEDVLPDSADANVLGGVYGVDAYQALAWAYSRSGMPEKSRQPLEIAEQWFADRNASVEMLQSRELFDAARSAVLKGDRVLALERLEQAVAAGWREYYVERHDPRWSALAEDPRYQELMAEVKADVDRQRAEVERIDAEEDFRAKLDAVRAARQR